MSCMLKPCFLTTLYCNKSGKCYFTAFFTQKSSIWRYEPSKGKKRSARYQENSRHLQVTYTSSANGKHVPDERRHLRFIKEHPDKA